jgi:hypothetical protein
MCVQAPDPWLDNQNPWELPQLDVAYEVRFYGHADRLNDDTPRAVWAAGVWAGPQRSSPVCASCLASVFIWDTADGDGVGTTTS